MKYIFFPIEGRRAKNWVIRKKDVSLLHLKGTRSAIAHINCASGHGKLAY